MSEKYAELKFTNKRINNCVKDLPYEPFPVFSGYIVIKLGFIPNDERINVFNSLKQLYDSNCNIGININKINIIEEETIIELPKGLSNFNEGGYRELVDQINDCIVKTNNKCRKK